jgi:glucose dehydrogenase
MIGGQLRKVVLQANKNGFFYVLDRQRANSFPPRLS